MNPILFDFPMPITTPRLILRPPHIGDGPALNAAVIESIDTLRIYMPWARTRPSIADSEIQARQGAANWILKENNEPYLPLYIFDKNTDHFIGATGFHNFDWQIPLTEIGYWIRTSHAGQGLMTEAIAAITQYAFLELKMQRISITCDSENIPSRKIPERLGYTLESTMKSNRRNINRDLCDTLVFTRHHANDLLHYAIHW